MHLKKNLEEATSNLNLRLEFHDVPDRIIIYFNVRNITIYTLRFAVYSIYFFAVWDVAYIFFSCVCEVMGSLGYFMNKYLLNFVLDDALS